MATKKRKAKKVVKTVYIAYSMLPEELKDVVESNVCSSVFADPAKAQKEAETVAKDNAWEFGDDEEHTCCVLEVKVVGMAKCNSPKPVDLKVSYEEVK